MADKSLKPREHTPESPNAFYAFRGAMEAIRANPAQFGVGLAGLADSRFALAGRLYQAAARGSFAQQLQVEIEELIKQGKVSQEYLKTNEAHACFADLLDSIDRISPDPKRYEAIRTAFLKVLQRGETGTHAPYAQQMLRIIYELSAGEILVLATAYTMSRGGEVTADSWLNDVANKSGILRSEIVEGIELSLMQKRLIHARSTRSGAANFEYPYIKVWGLRSRLTTLGQEVCETFARPQS